MVGRSDTVTCLRSASATRWPAPAQYGPGWQLRTAHRCSSFLWIPGHSELEGNIQADQLAKAACSLPVITPSALSPQEASNVALKAVSRAAQDNWDVETKGRHTHKIKPFLKKWASGSCDSRIKEVVLARLRIGHTRLTHEYILDRGPPSSCLQCNVPLSIEHIIIDCPLFLQQRNVLKKIHV